MPLGGFNTEIARLLAAVGKILFLRKGLSLYRGRKCPIPPGWFETDN